MKNFYIFMSGLVVGYLVMLYVYGSLTDTAGLARLASIGYRYGCVEAKGSDCPKKAEAYRLWIKSIMERVL